VSRAQTYLRETRQFLRNYTDGLNVRDLRRLFDRDAVEAYAVLARDQAADEPEDDLRRFFYRVKVVFLGISSKLTPARRLIFAVSLLSALMGLVNKAVVSFGGGGVPFGSIGAWFLLSYAGLLFLLVMELVDRVRVRDELEVARQLQADLLPHRSPEIPGFQFAHSYRTANEVGGDYYDFQQLPDGRLALVVGDASGHGIAAGLLMAIANATLKTAVDVDPAPEKVAELLNRTLFRTGDHRAFMTLFYALLDPSSGELEYVCAGHPFPLLRRAGGEVEELGTGALPLGLRAETELQAGRSSLGVGDLLVLFSDGLPESIDAQQDAYGFDRMRRVLATPGSSAGIHDRILQDFETHVGSEPLTDDLTLVVIARDS
jgi:sigma-B regulation protein RsbU (phosphoserine phosphatase)